MVKWLGYLDSNQGNARFRVWCLTAWLYPNALIHCTIYSEDLQLFFLFFYNIIVVHVK